MSGYCTPEDRAKTKTEQTIDLNKDEKP